MGIKSNNPIAVLCIYLDFFPYLIILFLPPLFTHFYKKGYLIEVILDTMLFHIK